jgi:hypothetical protein
VGDEEGLTPSILSKRRCYLSPVLQLVHKLLDLSFSSALVKGSDKNKISLFDFLKKISQEVLKIDY